MFLKSITKKDISTGHIYNYYRLCESFRLDGKPRHRNILNLGRLEQLHSDEQRRQLADCIEHLYKNTPLLFPTDHVVDQLARQFVARLRRQKALMQPPEAPRAQDNIVDLETIDLESIKHQEVRELGAEWLCQQAVAQLKIADALEKNGLDDNQIPLALTQIISRAVYPASELKTESWIKENSACALLHGLEPSKVSRHQLYDSALNLYDKKTPLELHLSNTTNEVFNLEDKLMLFDLTNCYFEGRKVHSKMAQFGRSKEKRSDCKLIVLALVINAEGFVKMSKLYKGNTADCTTLQEIMKLLRGTDAPPDKRDKKPVVAIDAGIATEENIQWFADNHYDYISVSRVKLKDYTLSSTQPVIITDNRKHPIQLNLVEQPAANGDRFLYVHSELKEAKEQAMDKKVTQKLELELQLLHKGLAKKRTTKKYDSILTRIGRIKERYKAVSRFFDITVKQQNGLATAVEWKVKEEQNDKENGVYFLRTSLQDKDEKTLWTIYNTLKEIEASFRILKTDLEIRPVFHQNDKSSEAHLFLAILAYSLVNTIRYQLKLKGIHYSWNEIIRKMNTQKLVISTMKNQHGKTIMIQRPSEPSAAVKEIYNALGYQAKPWNRKKFVLPEL